MHDERDDQIDRSGRPAQLQSLNITVPRPRVNAGAPSVLDTTMMIQKALQARAGLGEKDGGKKRKTSAGRAEPRSAVLEKAADKPAVTKKNGKACGEACGQKEGGGNAGGQEGGGPEETDHVYRVEPPASAMQRPGVQSSSRTQYRFCCFGSASFAFRCPTSVCHPPTFRQCNSVHPCKTSARRSPTPEPPT